LHFKTVKNNFYLSRADGTPEDFGVGSQRARAVSFHKIKLCCSSFFCGMASCSADRHSGLLAQPDALHPALYERLKNQSRKEHEHFQ
jgi:hypothetical protein